MSKKADDRQKKSPLSGVHRIANQVQRSLDRRAKMKIANLREDGRAQDRVLKQARQEAQDGLAERKLKLAENKFKFQSGKNYNLQKKKFENRKKEFTDNKNFRERRQTFAEDRANVADSKWSQTHYGMKDAGESKGLGRAKERIDNSFGNLGSNKYQDKRDKFWSKFYGGK